MRLDLDRLDLDRLRDFPPLNGFKLLSQELCAGAAMPGWTFCPDAITLSTHAFHWVKLLGSLGSTVGAGIIL